LRGGKIFDFAVIGGTASRAVRINIAVPAMAAKPQKALRKELPRPGRVCLEA